MPRERKRRRVCFVTGTRAEFGLMASTLRALRDEPGMDLQIVATGSHTHANRGATLKEIRQGGWKVDAIVPWKDDTSRGGTAQAMGMATARLASIFEKLKTAIVLVVGDRVEAFAAAAAAHVGGQIVAHVHGGDRALGQVDDALRHAISKLAHVHFVGTRASGERLFAMGEDRWRIHFSGAPGIDGIRTQAAERESRVESPRHGHAVLLLHPTFADDRRDGAMAKRIVDATRAVCENRIIALAPNNDPGSDGIHAELRERHARNQLRLIEHMPRIDFLSALRGCAVLVGNSSSGIIEAGSFGTPVVDIGRRQEGRERGPNVLHTEWTSVPILAATVARAIAMPRTRPADNPYERGGAGRRIANGLSGLVIDDHLRRKLIRY